MYDMLHINIDINNTTEWIFEAMSTWFLLLEVHEEPHMTPAESENDLVDRIAMICTDIADVAYRHSEHLM